MLTGQTMQNTEIFLLGVALLLITSIFGSKMSNKFSIPFLLVYIGIGMLAGSEGIGKIYFDNAEVSKSLGVVALSFILFAGGLDTEYKSIKKVFKESFLLSTFGVLFTALILGYSASLILKIPLKTGLLLGAIVSSTDAAAVFSILRSKKISLKGVLRPLLEFESGSNDPMAFFLTIFFIELTKVSSFSILDFILLFLKNISIGIVSGFLVGKILFHFIKNLRLEYEGLYSVFTFAAVLFTYSATTLMTGNGFLAVYVLGIYLSSKNFFYKEHLSSFHDSLAWLMQIVMFLALGLLVFPSQLTKVFFPGLIITLILVVLARPISVFLCLVFSKIKIREKIMISWVGLRGAAPIVLATFPKLAGVENADIIFNVVFFVVIISLLVQGTSIPFVAKLLKVEAPLKRKKTVSLKFSESEQVDADLFEFIVPYDSKMQGKAISEINFPKNSLAILVCRNDKYIIVKGNTVLEAGDVVLFLTNKTHFSIISSIFASEKI